MNCWQSIFGLLLITAPMLAQETEQRESWRQANRSDQPFADALDLNQGVSFLENVSLNWGRQRRCVTCHTNGYALVALSATSPNSNALSEIRSFASRYLKQQVDRKPSDSVRVEGVVATTAMLLLSDVLTGKNISPEVRQGLDYSWSKLSENGTWDDWLQCNWPPFESDTAFGNTLMLIALGTALERQPRNRNVQDADACFLTEVDLKNARRLIAGLRNRAPLGLHDVAMRLWADKYWPVLVEDKLEQRWLESLRDCQNADGGWAIASLAAPSWKHDSSEPLPKLSDGYPTAFVTFVLQQRDSAFNLEAIERGQNWLRSHQRIDGRWFGRSPRRDTKHFLSHSATAFALLCLTQESNDKTLLENR